MTHTLIKTIFVDRETLSLDERSLDQLTEEYQHLPTWLLKQVVIQHLSPKSQLRFLDQLSEPLLMEWYCHEQNQALLSTHFDSCTLPIQDRVIAALTAAGLTQKVAYFTDMKTKAQQQFAAKDNSLPKGHAVLDSILDSNLGKAQLTVVAKQLANTYSAEQLLKIGEAVILSFANTYAVIRSDKAFKHYLKLLAFLETLSSHQPGLIHKQLPLVELLVKLLMTHADQHILPIIAKLPMRFAEFFVQRLNQYERIGDFEKRNLYAKLLAKLKQQAQAPDADYFRFLLSRGTS